ncbi:MAG: protein-S-isoprenylcysteine methyltransferase [Hydrocarboniphaga sp.]|uniref:methyltransferase family protein n=1 Tax=Hydrocarboniphaga sp. TaxID=2033016 RepID=UPI00262E9E8E|nr:isoprenylcysteine carboxylmethyltransferase family protein [Hydrocarboniphaga sp.]MDB5968848.1 protein-S-isoprenylcysteine methyltransferase [Hydrocarboniphaga sp.]
MRILDLMGMIYGLSELGLLIFKRAGRSTRDADRQSLVWLWPGIGSCVFAGITVAYSAPRLQSPLLLHWHVLGIGLFALGLALRWYAILYLGRFFTVNVAIATDHRVIDSGPYRWVRHPSYSGALLAFVGYGIALGNWISLALVTLPIAGMFLRRIAIEEAALTSALGEAYIGYAARTRRLIPGIW